MFILGLTLLGGLGNRLFQIASIYGLSRKYNRRIVCVDNVKNQHSNIDYFENILRNFQSIQSYNQKYDYKILEPNDSPLNISIKSLPLGNIICLGYFQNEGYFIEYRNELLNLFEIEPHRKTNILEKYPNINSKYFIHIRRGDYVNHFLHYINLDEYYKQSIEFIKSKDKDAKFYIFSNDNEYCKTLNWENCEIIQNYDEVDSIYMMSLCEKGGICPNSSYSWWGGWLNKNNDKIIIFPNKWFNNDWVCDIGFKNSYICNLTSFEFNQKF